MVLSWSDFLLDKDDTWEPIANLTGSENMICEFQKAGTRRPCNGGDDAEDV